MENELAWLVRAFKDHLKWRNSLGIDWISANPCPRITAPQPSEPQSIRNDKGFQGEKTPGTAKLRQPPALHPPARSPQSAKIPQSPDIRQAPAPHPPASVPPMMSDAPQTPLGAELAQLKNKLANCRRCRLAEGRKNVVFGEGNPQAAVMFIGEAPGHEEDLQGLPFVGAAGQLLTKMIGAMGLDRQDVYIANIIKCRPPKNRDPAPDEIDACEYFLLEQIGFIAPQIIITLGNFAAKTLLRSELGITKLRGRFHTYHGIPLMPTFHPAYLLRNPQAKRPVWEDLKQVMAEMDRLGINRRRE